MTGVADRAKRCVTRFGPEDRFELRAFQARMFGEHAYQVDEIRHAWLFEQHPCAIDGPAIWISKRDDRIVGEQAAIPFDLRVGEASIRAAWAVDLMIDPAWRLRGVGPAMSAALLESYRVVSGVEISEAAYRSFLRAGWTDLGTISRYVCPLDTRAIVASGRIGSRWFSLVRPIAGLMLRLVHGTAKIRALRCTLVPINRFDDRVEAIWSSVKTTYPVLARRDAQMLRWRFDEAFDADEYSRFYLERSGRVVGYVVIRKSSWHGTPIFDVIDYLAAPRDLVGLFVNVKRVARQRGAAALFIITRNRWVDRRRCTLGFLSRPTQADIRFMVRVADDDPLRELMVDPAQWFVTAADSDLALSGNMPDNTP